jgi:hypothetical protein
METVHTHTYKYLNNFISKSDKLFDDTFLCIQNNLKEKWLPLLKYLDCVLNIYKSDNNNELKVLHLHFEEDLDDTIITLISEYLLIRSFKQNQRIFKPTDRVCNPLDKQKRLLNSKLKKLSICPSDASGKNGGNRIYKNWISAKNEIVSLMKFYEELNTTNDIHPKTIFNCQIKINNKIVENFKTNPFAVDINQYSNLLSYCITNSEKGLNEIDKYDNFVNGLETIILFDCESKKIMSNYSFDEIDKWNKEFETNFKQYIIFTFGKEVQSLQSIRNKIELIKDRFKIPNESTYTIFSSELDFLFKRNKGRQVQVEFVGFEESTFWNIFLLETSIRELYELRSFKMMNIYSLCLTSEIKEYILDELFSDAESSVLISANTKQALVELTNENLITIKDALNQILDVILDSNLISKVKFKMKNDTSLVVSDSVIKSKILKYKISNALDLNETNKLISWSEINKQTNNSILILSYQDQGKSPNYFYPNIHEFKSYSNLNVSAIFINFFFYNQYNLSKYYLLRDILKFSNHKVRRQYFNWNLLKSIIESTRPKSKNNIDWNLENEYSSYDNRETYKLKVKGQRAKTYNSSDLFIYKCSEGTKLKVDRIDTLLALDNTEEVYQIQNLDEIQENINIYEKIIDIKQQEEELEIIRNKFNLEEEEVGRLWKILLKNEAIKKGEVLFYNEIKSFLEYRNLNIVSFSHYKNTWINPLSDSISPLSNQVFISLCEFLNIPKIYFILIQRIKNTSKQSSRQSTRNMNQLLMDLFNDGCFDDLRITRFVIGRKLDQYKINHPLAELGIAENYLLDNLVALVELIYPELKFAEVEFIEKIDL